MKPPAIPPLTNERHHLHPTHTETATTHCNRHARPLDTDRDTIASTQNAPTTTQGSLFRRTPMVRSGHSNATGDVPPVVLHCQLKVRQRDDHEGRDDEQQNEGQEQDAEQRVHLAAPHRREDVMQLDGDGGEGQQARHDRLEPPAPVPHHLRYLARHLRQGQGFAVKHTRTQQWARVVSYRVITQ